jgi:hypothetical protein
MALEQKQIRNIIAGGVLLLLVILVMWWFGVFEAKGSDEDQVRRVTERAQGEFNDHDWDDLLQYCWVDPDTPQRRKQWVDSVPRQANAIKIASFLHTQPLSVPVGAMEYQSQVSVVAQPIIGATRIEVPKGTIYYVKKNGVWLIDIERSAPTFGVAVPPR